MSDKVLIVEDCQSAREHIQNLFEGLGYNQFEYAPNGVEALKKAEAAQIICLDIVMPHMDGLECFSQIQQKWPNQKTVLFISFLAREESFKQAFLEQNPGSILLGKYPSSEKLKSILHPQSQEDHLDDPPPPQSIQEAV